MTTKDTSLTETLSYLGLPENEAKIYLAALELGTGSIWDIAQVSTVKRPTCYVILEKLATQGIAYRSSDAKRTVYSVIPPKELIELFDQRKKHVEAKLSELEAIANKTPYKPAIRLYEGMESIKKIYNQCISVKNQSVLIYGTADVLTHFPDFFAQWTTERVKMNNLLRVILPDNTMNRSIKSRNEELKRKTCYYPESQFNPKQEILIYQNTIAYVALFDKQPFATVIESPLFADFERERFEIMWGTGDTD